jgi:hypothetical protein
MAATIVDAGATAPNVSGSVLVTPKTIATVSADCATRADPMTALADELEAAPKRGVAPVRN